MSREAVNSVKTSPCGDDFVRVGSHCLAKSACDPPTSPNHRCKAEDLPVPIDDTSCWSYPEVSRVELGRSKAFHGMLCGAGYPDDAGDAARGCRDAYGRRVKWNGGSWEMLGNQNAPPWESWNWHGLCPPAAFVPCEDEPCPEPTPTPPPEPTVEPTPAPTPSDCNYTHFRLPWLCAQPSKPGCLDGKDWGNPGVVHIRRDGKPICKVNGVWKKCVRAYITAVLMNGNEKIEAGHACFPGSIPDGSWSQTYPPDMRFDCGDPWENPGDPENWNNGSCNIDFAAQNGFKLCAFGVCGETTMTARW